MREETRTNLFQFFKPYLVRREPALVDEGVHVVDEVVVILLAQRQQHFHEVLDEALVGGGSADASHHLSEDGLPDLVGQREERLRLPRHHQEVGEEGGRAPDGARLGYGEGGACALQRLLQGDRGGFEDARVFLDHGRMYAG